MITVKAKGNWNKTDRFFERMLNALHLGTLDKYGKMGVEALMASTPKNTGKTANSWTYEIVRKGTNVSIVWTNTNINKGQNIAILLQYGHGTRNGGYVKGRDYINPAMRAVFDQIAKDAWEEVVKT